MRFIPDIIRPAERQVQLGRSDGRAQSTKTDGPADAAPSEVPMQGLAIERSHQEELETTNLLTSFHPGASDRPHRPSPRWSLGTSDGDGFPKR